MFLQKKDNEAINICNELIQNYPNKYGAYNYRSFIYLSINQYDKALEDIDKAIGLVDHNKDFEQLPYMYERKADIYEAMLKSDNAREFKEKELEAYTNVIKRKPNDPVIYTLRGHLYDDLGEYQKAIADFKKAATLPHHLDEQVKKNMDNLGLKYTVDTQIASEYFMCGIIYQKIKDYANAIEMYTKGLELNPDDRVYWLQRAKCYEAIGEKAKAKADYIEYQVRSKGGH